MVGAVSARTDGASAGLGGTMMVEAAACASLRSRVAIRTVSSWALSAWTRSWRALTVLVHIPWCLMEAYLDPLGMTL